MALVSRKVLFDIFPCSVLCQSKRFRGKINIQKPKPPHRERAKFLAVTKPFFINPNKNKPLIELCNKNVNPWKKDEPENPYQQIIARELYDWFKKSRLVAFFHMNPMDAEQHFKAYVSFKKENMYYKNYGKKTMEMAVKNTPYEAILEIYTCHNMTVFSPEPNIKKMLAIIKKFPQLILLAAIYEGRFLSKDEIMHYSLIPDLQTAQANFVHTLNNVGGTVANQLTSHQRNLLAQLQERIKQLEEEKKS